MSSRPAQLRGETLSHNKKQKQVAPAAAQQPWTCGLGSWGPSEHRASGQRDAALLADD